MKLNHGIYQIRNILNNDIYIGKGSSFKLRQKSHFYLLEKNIHFNPHLQRAYNKYGKENFVFEIILYCEKRDLHYYEQSFVDLLDPEYNIRKICVNSPLGTKLSDEQRITISIRTSGSNNFFYGKKHTPESIQKMKENHPNVSGSYNSMYGKIQSDESKKKNRNSQLGEKSHNFGKEASEETLIKMSVARIGKKCYMFGKKHTEKTKNKMVKSHKRKHKEKLKNKQSDDTKIKRKRKPLSEETKNKISNVLKGKRSKQITPREVVLKIKEMLKNNYKVSEICKELNVSNSTIRKIRKGHYDVLYDLK